MILNCTLPYKQHIPNPALGYLKGFLQREGIHVKNVYWNVVLTRKIVDLYKGLGRQPQELFPVEEITLYIFKQLLEKDSGKSSRIGALFSSIFTRGELSEVVHSIKDTVDQYIKENSLHEVFLSGFTLKSFQWWMSFYIMQRLKELNPDIKVVIGGIYDESQAFAFMKTLPLTDYAIYGEGEYPLVHLVKALEEGTDLNHVPQLVYRDSSKILTGTPSRQCPSLDEYPFADHTDYFDTLKSLRVLQVAKSVIIPVWGSRSCNWNRCKFCVLNRGYAYRTRSPENIVQELEFQSKKHTCDTFMFVDTDVAGNKKRFKKLLKLLVKSVENRKRPYQLFGEISPVFIDSETARYMKLVSFAQIQVGFEAVVDSLLEKMQKRQKVAHNIQVLKYGAQYGLNIGGLNVMKGIPTETEEDILESIVNLKFLRFLFGKYHLDPIPFVLLKGSPFYDEMPEEERESWKEDLVWSEIAPTRLVSEVDRFEFFGFRKDQVDHHLLWLRFEHLLTFYVQQKCSYEWMEYGDGSFVEEKGVRYGKYALDRDETDILIYCDTIKTFSEIKKKFSHLSEGNLLEIMDTLKDSGLLYYDKNLCTVISVIEAARRKPVE